MKLKKAFTALALLLLLTSLLTMAPVFSWEGWSPGEFERFGPRVDRLRFNVYANPELEYDALEAHLIDYVDWGMTCKRMDKYLTDPAYDYIGVADYYERGGYEICIDHGPAYIDLNCNYTMSPLAGTWGFPAYAGKINPTYDVEFRRALAYLADKTTYVNVIMQGLGGEMDTVLPPSPPWGPFVDYDGYYYDGPPYYFYDPSVAASILDAAGWEDIDGDGNWLPNERNVPAWVDPARPEISEYLGGGLIFCMRTDKHWWMQWSIMFATEMEAIGIPVYRDADDRLPTLMQVMFFKTFHLYAGGWSLPRDPDFLYYLWHSNWNTGLLTLNINYASYSNPTYDYWAEKLKFAGSENDAKAACMTCQRILKEDVPAIPLVYYAGAKGYHKTAVAGPHAGETWHGLVNENGIGINSWWTPFNAHAEGYESGGMMIEGLSADVHELNIISSYMYYDRLVLEEMFDCLIRYDPYNPSFAGDMPWQCDGWKIETWDATGIMDPTYPDYPMATKITFCLDQNQPAVFHCGTPVTAQDYMFTWFFQQVCGPEVAWKYPDVERVYSVYIPDPYTLEVKFDAQSMWFLHQLGHVPVLPKYVWETALDDPAQLDGTPGVADLWYLGVFPATYMDKAILAANVNPDWDPISAVLYRNMFDPANAAYHIGSGPFKWISNFVRGNYYVLEKHILFGHRLDAWDLFRHQGDIDMAVSTVEPSPGVTAKNVHAITAKDLYYIMFYYGEPASSYPPADLNGDGLISFIDLTILIGHYYTVPGEGVW